MGAATDDKPELSRPGPCLLYVVGQLPVHHEGARVEANSQQAYERRWWTLGVLCLSLTVISIDNTILNVALPSIVESLNARGSELQLLIDGYTIVFACLLLTAGSLGDKLGRKGILTAGLALFGTFSALAAFSTSSVSYTHLTLPTILRV